MKPMSFFFAVWWVLLVVCSVVPTPSCDAVQLRAKRRLGPSSDEGGGDGGGGGKKGKWSDTPSNDDPPPPQGGKKGSDTPSNDDPPPKGKEAVDWESYDGVFDSGDEAGGKGKSGKNPTRYRRRRSLMMPTEDATSEGRWNSRDVAVHPEPNWPTEQVAHGGEASEIIELDLAEERRHRTSVAKGAPDTWRSDVERMLVVPNDTSFDVPSNDDRPTGTSNGNRRILVASNDNSLEVPSNDDPPTTPSNNRRERN